MIHDFWFWVSVFATMCLLLAVGTLEYLQATMRAQREHINYLQESIEYLEETVKVQTDCIRKYVPRDKRPRRPVPDEMPPYLGHD